MRPSSEHPVRRITLLTDFGDSDGYVAAMRGVIARIAPRVLVDDAGHDIPPGDVAHAGFALARYAHLYPPETVHLIVVDPGVGTQRRALAAAIDGRFYVAPDNGVLTRIIATAHDAQIVVLSEPAFQRAVASATFHGRDIFAPAAAYLAEGVALDRLGAAVADPVMLELAQPTRAADRIAGTVVLVDRFGNLITNLPRAWVDPGMHVAVAGRAVGNVRRTYADVDRGQLVALIGSDDLLEIGMRDGNAAEALQVERGAHVLLTRRAPDPFVTD